MTVTVQYLRAMMHAMLALMWTPALVYAATTTSLDQTLNSVSASVVWSLALLSSLTSATALVMRIDKQLRSSPDAQLTRPWLFVAAHMLGGWLATVLAFMVIEGSGLLTGWNEIAFILTASFNGSKFIELMAEKVFLKGTA